MAPLGQAVLLGLVLGGLVVPFQSFRMNYKNKITSSKRKFSGCCNITEGTIYDNKNNVVPVQAKRCIQHKTIYKIPQQDYRCTAREYSHFGKQEWTLLKAETLENKECVNAPWCSDVTLPKCYNITEGELSPWYDANSFSEQKFPLGMAVSVSGKICQRSERLLPPIEYRNGSPHERSERMRHRFAKLKIKVVEILGDEECESDKWKHHGLEAAPECDDFSFWKQVLSIEGIKAPNWEALIAAAKASSPEGMAWGTTMSDEAADDTLWNARRDTLLKLDDLSSSWS